MKSLHMKSSHWILMISALALFSAHQTYRSDADKPDYSRNPAAMFRPVYDLKTNHKTRYKTNRGKAGAHQTRQAAAQSFAN